MVVLLAFLDRKGQRYLREEGVRIDAGEVGSRVEPQLVVTALQSLGAKIFHPPVSISGSSLLRAAALRFHAVAQQL